MLWEPALAQARAGALLLILDRTSGTAEGIASSSWCPRFGMVWLFTAQGDKVEIPTTCKTWRCKGCRDRLMSLFQARVQHGCSILGRCAFITFTYEADARKTLDAAYVARDWKGLWRKLRHDPLRNLKWLRVMELTKKGIPHHHLVAGTIGPDEEIACYGRPFDIRRYRKRFDHCACVSHRFARAWQEVTMDSYIVHAREIDGPLRAAWYMSKYLLKTFMAEDRMRDFGMARRWSSSRGWPGNARLKLAHSDWSLIMHFRGSHGTEQTNWPPLLRREGTDLAKAMGAKRKKARVVKTLERLVTP